MVTTCKGKKLVQEVDVLSYNIHSGFTAHAPNRRDLPLPSDIFSKYTLVNKCPGKLLDK